ncbi:HesA/MoeB/ThiF family protein [Agrobacterium tumefaciens]|uniref:HesA/MoeB/ThiF family protein n=1 Tax=Agrobacterium tumefaciens TaxID=358 RepID=UPI001571D316|nr:ThiF family adenylyltransferase [Agrobacterium tumefaciens]
MTWLDRQSFLGSDSDQILRDLTVGLVGLGGGNSHVIQQLAHLGIGGFVLVDDDVISESNLNRLVGGTSDDVQQARPKTEIAKRVVLSVNPKARVDCHQSKWQEVAEHLRVCDIIIGGVDRIIAKSELEAFCRRFLIPYIDMGMDVHRLGDDSEFLIAGQVVLSSPGTPCLRCLGVVTDSALTEEAGQYGDAGGKPQVVWPNGLLASTAVGLLVQLFTPWHGKPVKSAYFAYDANEGTLMASERLRRKVDKECHHFPVGAVGDPMFDVRKLGAKVDDDTADQPSGISVPPGSIDWRETIIKRIRRWFAAWG